MTLPDGFRVTLTPHVLRTRDGKLLLGGSPLTAMRLGDRAKALLASGAVTVVDPATETLAERLLATNLAVPDLANLPGVPARDLTVVIPVRDRPGQLDRALAALRPLDCVVVDDASESADAIAEVTARHQAMLVRLPTNAGPAAARNAGRKRVATSYVAFVDSDVEVTAAALLQLTRHFADPAVALVGPRVRGVSRSDAPTWFERYDTIASSLTLGTTPAVVRPGAAVAWLPSACMVARTSVLADGFDPSLRVGEDVDLVWRLVGAGHRVRYDPAIEALHDARPTMSGWLGRKFVYGSGGAALATRHGNKLAPAVLTPTYAIAAASVLSRRCWTGPVAAAALATGTLAVRRVLPQGPGRDAVAARVAARGMAWAVQQESALMLRHWWPAALTAAVISRRARTMLISALAVDVLIAYRERQNTPDPVGLPLMLAGRRLDDLAYGAGLWWGAVRARSYRVLLPRRPGV